MLSESDPLAIAIHPDGVAVRVAERLDITVTRLYQILNNGPLVKFRRIIRAIAAANPKGARLIKAELDTFFASILKPEKHEYTETELYQHVIEMVQPFLAHMPRAQRKRALIEFIQVCQSYKEQLERNPDSGRMRAVK